MKLQSTFVDFFNFFFPDKLSVRVKGVEISLTSVCLNRRSCKFLYAEYTMNKIFFWRAMKAYLWGGGIFPLLLEVGNRWR